MIREILLLGQPALYEESKQIQPSELSDMALLSQDLHDTLTEYRRTHGAGRAIAAPQVGVFKRMIYQFIDKPMVFLNPVLEFPDEETMRVLDDCMSFPGLFVWVRRHKRCVVRYRDLDWQEQTLSLEGDLSELLQHEYDHLDGILATMRAENDRAFVYQK